MMQCRIFTEVRLPGSETRSADVFEALVTILAVVMGSGHALKP